jgi:hypothetical protein
MKYLVRSLIIRAVRSPGLATRIGDSYSGSFNFDLDGGGQPTNVSVSFALSEPE